MFWIFLTIIVLVLAYFGDERVIKNPIQYSLVRVILVLVLSYVIALCSNGMDRESYLILYQQWISQDIGNLFKLIFSSEGFEVGIILLAKICNLIGLSGVGFLFVISLLTNSLVVSTLYRYRYPVFVFFLYLLSGFYMQQSNLARQMLAVAIGLFSLRYIEEKRIKEFLLFVFLAFTIHQSSIILLLLTPFCFLEASNNRIVNIIMLALWLISFGFYLGFFPEFQYLSIYFEDTKYSDYASLDNLLGTKEFTLDIIYNFFIAFYFLFANKTKSLLIPASFILGGALMNACFGASFFSRLSLYFTPAFCIYLPTLLVENVLVNKTQDRKFLGKLLQIVIFAYYIRFLITHRVTVDFHIGQTMGNILDIFA